MEFRTESPILRKITATFVTTTIFSLLFVILYFIDAFESTYDQGRNYLGWLFVYAVYIGSIILIYGNLVSIIIEYLQRKWFLQHDWLYVLILGLFGLANGILFQSVMAALFGMVAAIVYGIFDKWLYKRNLKGKSMKPFLIIPITLVVICWVYLELTSPPKPPFTKEDAVISVTSGEGTVINEFPKYIGQWEGMIEGHEVIRETSVEEIGNEVYIVTFTENWKRGSETGTWTLSYEVERQSSTLYGGEGNPPYGMIN